MEKSIMAVSADSIPAPAIQPAPITLTKKAETYLAGHLRPKGCPPGVDPVDWRNAIAKRIERHRDAEQALIEALDAVEVDPDLEPSLGAPEIPPTRTVRGGFYGWHTEQGSQEHWAAGLLGDHEREEEDEHGGDILDEPHDDLLMDLEPADGV